MWKIVGLVLLTAASASAMDSSRLEQAMLGAAGTAASVEYAREFAPGRGDLARHAAAGGTIAAVVGSLTSPGSGWKAGVIVGAGKELVNDALLGRGQAQLDDFVVTASAAIFSSCLSSKYAPLLYFDGSDAGVRFGGRF